MPILETPILMDGIQHKFELDTGTLGNFITEDFWEKMGKPPLEPSTHHYESASKHLLPVLGTFQASVQTLESSEGHPVELTVTSVPGLNLLGRGAIRSLEISLDTALKQASSRRQESVYTVSSPEQTDETLWRKCQEICNQFPDLWKDELGCLKDVELEIKFKPDAKPVFKKARPVPVAIQEDLTAAYDQGISKGIWIPVQFCDYGTPVVPVRKAQQPGQKKPALRICGDYSVTVNPQLEMHRQPMPRPEDLMRRLGGGHGFSKIDLADAYNQIKLAPKSQ
jgi:hypothetical protein